MTDPKKTEANPMEARTMAAEQAAGDSPQSAAESARVFEQAERAEQRAARRAGPTIGDGGITSSGMNMMESAGSIGGGAVSATRGVLREAIDATEEVASELVVGVTHVARDIVHGVHDVGLEVRDGATGLIGAAGTIGGTAVGAVANLLVEVVGGVRHVIGAAVGQQGRLAGARREALDMDEDAMDTMPPRMPARQETARRP